MSFADSLLHPRESTLLNGWGMEETDVSNERALYIKPSESPPRGASGTPVTAIHPSPGSTLFSPASTSSDMRTSWSFLSKTATTNPFTPSTLSKQSRSELSNDIDVCENHYESPTEYVVTRKKSRSILRKKRSSDKLAASPPHSPISKDPKSPVPDTSRGRGLGFKKFTLRAKSKSKDRTQLGNDHGDFENSIPPVPVLNLPIAQRFMRSEDDRRPPLLHEIIGLSDDLWNDTPLLPSTRRASRMMQMHLTTIANAHESEKLPPSGVPDLNQRPSKVFHRRSSLEEVFTLGSLPKTPEGDPLPGSFLSMSTSSMDLRARRRWLGKANFLSSLAGEGLKSHAGMDFDIPSSNLEDTDFRHFSFLEADGTYTPMSWIEVEHPVDMPLLQPKDIIPGTKIHLPDILLSRHASNERANSTSADINRQPDDAYHDSISIASIYSPPTVQRGRQNPFPIQPILPQDMIPRLRAKDVRQVPRYKGLICSTHD